MSKRLYEWRMYKGRLEELLDQEYNTIRMIRHRGKIDPLFLPIRLTGGIGDVITSMSIFKTLQECTPQIVIYSPHAEALKYFYPDLPIFRGDIPDYSWCLCVNSVCKFEYTPSFYDFTSMQCFELAKLQQIAFREEPELETFVRQHPQTDFAMTLFARDRGLNKRTFPAYSLGFKYPKEYIELSRRHEAQKIITIHDGFDTQNESVVRGRATKQWKWSSWNELVKKLKKYKPDYKIIQLGSKTSRIIDGIDECLVNQTTITEAFDVLSYSSLHIDGDSGLVHAATHLGVPCVVMFGPTPDYFYGYPQNKNIKSQKTCQESCFWLSKHWMDQCPIGFPSPQCMDDIEVDEVLSEGMSFLK